MLVGAGAVGDAARTVPAADPGRRDGHLHDAETGCSTGLFNRAVALLFPTLQARFGAGPTFLFFAVTSFLALIFAWRLLPETKGKSLEAVEQQLTSTPTRGPWPRPAAELAASGPGLSGKLPPCPSFPKSSLPAP